MNNFINPTAWRKAGNGRGDKEVARDVDGGQALDDRSMERAQGRQGGQREAAGKCAHRWLPDLYQWLACKQFALVIYESTIVIKAIFESGVNLET